jgi:Flp pilus assembly pilin Flp
MQMNFVTSLFVRFRESSRGQTMTEYVLIVSAIAVLCIAAYQAIGTTVSTQVSSVNTLL